MARNERHALTRIALLAGHGTGVMLLVATGLGLLPVSVWWINLCSHPKLQFATALAALALAFLVGRRRRAALLYGSAATLNAAFLVPFFLPAPTVSAPGDVPLRLLVLNVCRENHEHDRMREWIQTCQPDLVVVQELTGSWRGALRHLDQEFPYHRVVVREDTCGLGVWSRHPLQGLRVRHLGHIQLPAFEGHLRVPGAVPISFLACHPVAPKSPRLFDLRNRQLRGLAGLLASSRASWIVAGDLNCTPWSSEFRRLRERTGLQDSARGFGLPGTWPAVWAPLRLPLDHCLHSPGIAVRRHEVGPDVGSDHLPLLVELALPPSAADD